MPTKVFYAGKPPGSFSDVVSIFTNPDGEEGSNVPLLQPFTHLDRICYDSRIRYFETIVQQNFIKPFGSISPREDSPSKKGKTGLDSPIQRSAIGVINYHNLGYIPAAILIDRDTRETISGQQILQNVNNKSFRVLSLTADTTYIYLKEYSFIYQDPLPSLTKSYTLLLFDQRATVPEFA